MVFNFLAKVYWRFMKSPEAQARHLGVKIGENCLIDTRRWPSEPYLITIGNNVQITNRVAFHTHGVEIVSVNYVLILMFLEKYL